MVALQEIICGILDLASDLFRYVASYFICKISLTAFTVYIGSAIYTSSIPDIVTSFGVSQVKATLGLTLYILAYGVGPMFLAPFQELPSFGRNPIYIGGLALFVLFNVPIILAKNFSTVLAFRFLSGFVGSPALATGVNKHYFFENLR